MKRGETEKLEFPFNTAGLLEIFMPNLNDWYRATAKDFRSFNGPRRISEPTEVILGNVDVSMRTYDYYGPVFMWGTNKIIEYTDTGSLAKNEIWDKVTKISEQRG
jgi:hypothetical protein